MKRADEWGSDPYCAWYEMYYLKTSFRPHNQQPEGSVPDLRAVSMVRRGDRSLRPIFLSEFAKNKGIGRLLSRESVALPRSLGCTTAILPCVVDSLVITRLHDLLTIPTQKAK